MKTYERFADKGYHSSIATTFGIDFNAYENMMLPRLRAAGCRNNLVLADRHMLGRAMSDDLQLPGWAGAHYTVGGASAAGVFHPKLFLQFGREGGRVMIGSGNLTAAGIAGNLEIASIVECSSDASPERTVVQQCWHYLKRHLAPEDEAQSLQIRWMLGRTPWLMDMPEGSNLAEMDNGFRLGLLASDSKKGIAQRFIEQVRGKVNRLIIVSPYWDQELSALKALARSLLPKQIAVLIDPKTGRFPKQSSDAFSNLKIYDRSGFHGKRFIHAKLIVAESDSADYLLYGSTNCTFAALGNDQKAGINEEASLFRETPPGEIVAQLALDEQLSLVRLVDPDDLPDWAGEEEPLEDLPEEPVPGQFVLTGDSLTWIPSEHFGDPEHCQINLSDRVGTLIASHLERLNGSLVATQRFRVPSLADRPAFARVIDSNGVTSLRGIVCDRAQLSLAIREPHSRRTEKLIDQLEVESDANPLIMEILEDLLKIDAQEAGSSATKNLAFGTNGASTEQEKHYRTLPYSEFIARRRPHSDRGPDRTSLAASGAAHVYDFLDRLLGLNSQPAWLEAHDLDDEIADALKVQDEGKRESGETIPHRETPGEDAATRAQELEDRRRCRQRKWDKSAREKLIQSCKVFIERATEKSKAVGLDTQDFLRLRLLLMIVLDAASQPRHSGMDVEAQGQARQILTAEGDDAWPRLIGMLLFCVFGGNKPAISGARLLDDHDQLPDDLIKCWSTCYWALQACMAAPVSAATRQRDIDRFQRIAEQAYRLTLPSRCELLSYKVYEVMDAMSARYSTPLGIEADQIQDGHKRLVAQLFPERPREV